MQRVVYLLFRSYKWSLCFCLICSWFIIFPFWYFLDNFSTIDHMKKKHICRKSVSEKCFNAKFVFIKQQQKVVSKYIFSHYMKEKLINVNIVNVKQQQRAISGSMFSHCMKIKPINVNIVNIKQHRRVV